MPAFMSKLDHFFKTDLWRIDSGALSPMRSRLLRAMRTLVASVLKFGQDQCYLRSSALTLYTLLSIVPVLAMAFGIAQGFGLETAIQKQLIERLHGHKEVANWMINFAYSLLSTTKGGLIAGIGVLVLFWTVIKVLKNIEVAFNAIWKTDQQRSFTRTISDYLAIMLIAPLLLIISSRMTVAITKQVDFMSDQIQLIGFLCGALYLLLKLLPYCMVWALFTFIYIGMPNIKVNTVSGIIGGVIAGTLYDAFQWIYIGFQVGVSNYNAIYGSFAALPLFIVWLQFSWLIVLFGAEICYAHQNLDKLEFVSEPSLISSYYKRLLALSIVRVIVKEFQQAGNYCTVAQISGYLEAPAAAIRYMMRELLEAGLIVQIQPPGESGPKAGNTREGDRYLPAADLQRFTLKYVIDRLEEHGDRFTAIAPSRELERISECLKSFGEAVERSPANVLLQDI